MRARARDFLRHYCKFNIDARRLVRLHVRWQEKTTCFPPGDTAQSSLRASSEQLLRSTAGTCSPRPGCCGPMPVQTKVAGGSGRHVPCDDSPQGQQIFAAGLFWSKPKIDKCSSLSLRGKMGADLCGTFGLMVVRYRRCQGWLLDTRPARDHLLLSWCKRHCQTETRYGPLPATVYPACQPSFLVHGSVTPGSEAHCPGFSQ